jgi:hypothetical protein
VVEQTSIGRDSYRVSKGKTTPLGHGRSENSGAWMIKAGKLVPGASYYATVARRGSCLAAKSNVLKIG